MPGAVYAANEISNWARRCEFDVVETVTDESRSSDVTIERLRTVLQSILVDDGQTIDTFVLHFAGHGFRSSSEGKLWLPTNWKKELRGISAEGLRKRLYRHGITNLSIFSDACRSVVTDIDSLEIDEDSILGAGPYDAKAPILDRFNAVSDGFQAFMVAGSSPKDSRCVFSNALLEGLWGHSDAAFDKYERGKVTAESLALFLQKRLREIGTIYGISCSPENYPGIPRDHLIYYDEAQPPAGERPAPPTWPNLPKSVIDRSDISAKIGLRPDIFLPHSDRGTAREVTSAQARGRTPGKKPSSGISNESDKIRRKFQLSSEAFTFGANLIVNGGEVRQIWTMSGEIARLAAAASSSEYVVDLDEVHSTPVLVEFVDGIFASMILYESLVTVLSRDAKGVIGWLCIEPWGDRFYQMEPSINAIAQLRSGDLSARDADFLAIEFRREKHVNPTLGALSSYLYDYTGDTESIRRMAYFYADRNQPIPYDIALLGLLDLGPGQHESKVLVPATEARPDGQGNDDVPAWVKDATPEVKGRLAGAWPLFRQGWTFIDDPEPVEAAAALGLKELAEHLLPSHFTSFDCEGGEIAISILGLRESL